VKAPRGLAKDERAAQASHDDGARPDRETIARLADEIARLNDQGFMRSQRTGLHILLWQFARGLAFGLGSVLGASILVSLLGWWIAQIEFIPILGDWAARIAAEIEAAR
jgi:hypothetical protein